MFFSKETSLSKDCYDFLKELIQTLIHYECKNHRNQNHILFSLNIEKQFILEQLDKISVTTSPFIEIQKLQIETRQQLHSRYHQLQHIENAYIFIMDESKRDQVLHITRFDHDKIEQLYEIFSSQNSLYKELQKQDAFFEAIKNELMPILTKFI